MARVNVFLKDELLAEVDAEAVASRVKRSALIQLALMSYLQARRAEREEAEARREMDEASRGMDALAEKLGSWDPVRVIRDFRDRRGPVVAEPRTPRRAKRRKTRS